MSFGHYLGRTSGEIEGEVRGTVKNSNLEVTQSKLRNTLKGFIGRSNKRYHDNRNIIL